MKLTDAAVVATVGFRGRAGRVGLCASGVALGVAAMVAVLVLSSSSRAAVVARVDALGTNLLTVTPGQDPGSGAAHLSPDSVAMVGRIGPVQRTSAVEALAQTVRRNDRVDPADTGGIAVAAAGSDLALTLRLHLDGGRFLAPATDRFPVVVLGAQAATYLGVDLVDGRAQVWLGQRWFTVIGVLDPSLLAPELDRSALISFAQARAAFGAGGSPSAIYVRTDPAEISAVQAVLAATTDPQAPQAVAIARPSDALTARAAATSAYTALLVGIGAVALMVGGLGIANMLVVSVLERRVEIGVRRALGATSIDIAVQFVGEAVGVSTAGGILGVVAGTMLAAGYGTVRGWPVTVAPGVLAVAALAATLIGAVAGLYPARRAASLAPAEALRSS